MDSEMIMGLAKSLNQVSLKGMEAGAVMERRKYQFLLKAVKEYIELKGPVTYEQSEAFLKMKKAYKSVCNED